MGVLNGCQTHAFRPVECDDRIVTSMPPQQAQAEAKRYTKKKKNVT